MGSPAGRVTRLLDEARHGRPQASDELIPLIYAELRRIAGALMKRERSDHTLQPTALVHEAWMRLGDGAAGARNRAHFLALAAHSMRQVLLDHARRHNAEKRGGANAGKFELSEELLAQPVHYEDIIAMDRALNRLAELDPQQGRVVELRFFAGLSVEETAEVMMLSEITIKREWRSAKAWLNRELKGIDADDSRPLGTDQGDI